MDYQIVETYNVAPGDRIYTESGSGDCLKVGIVTVTIDLNGKPEVFHKSEILEIRRSWLNLI